MRQAKFFTVCFHMYCRYPAAIIMVACGVIPTGGIGKQVPSSKQAVISPSHPDDQQGDDVKDSAGQSKARAASVINPPAGMPLLVQAVKIHWARLASDEERESLVADCLNTTPYADWRAWRQMRFYYPKTAEEVALKLLARPIYDQRKLWDFIQDELVKEQREGRWRALIDKYVEDNGDAVKEVLPFWLYWIHWDTDFEETPEHLAGRAAAKKFCANSTQTLIAINQHF